MRRVQDPLEQTAVGVFVGFLGGRIESLRPAPEDANAKARVTDKQTEAGGQLNPRWMGQRQHMVPRPLS